MPASRTRIVVLAIAGLWSGVLAAVLLVPRLDAADAPRPFRRAIVIRMQGMISPLMVSYVERSLESARQEGADLVILEIESPGGFLKSSLALAERFRDLDWAHVVAYVPREALSGAAIAALGCDDLVMHPLAVIGDAGPIFRGEGGFFRHAPEKIRSDLARRVRDLAEAKGRPPALAEAMVDLNLEVFEVRNLNTGEVRYLSDKELEAVEAPADWKKVRPVIESRPERFLELNGKRAAELGFAQAVVQSRSKLLERYRVEGEPRVIRPGAVDLAVYVLNWPVITGLLFVVGLVALYFELSAPGISIGGLLAGLCFALFFWSRFLGGTAGWLEVILFLSGVVFLGVEFFVFPGFGVAGVTGFLLIFASLILASQDFVVPQTSGQMQTLGTTVTVIAAAGVVVLIAAGLISHYFGRIPLLSRLALAPPSADSPESKNGDGKAAGDEAGGYRVGVGDWGVAESPLRPAGKAIFGGDYVDVVADGSFVERGRQVRVIAITGNRVVVREVPPEPPASLG